MRQGNPRIGGRCNYRTDTGHYLESDSFAREHLRFLAATAEDKWVSSLEAADHPSLPGFFDQDPVNLVLGHCVVASPLARVNELGALSDIVEYLRVKMEVVDNDLCSFQYA